MRVTGWLSPSQLDVAWVALAVGCLAVMVAWPSWETIPFHVIWISLTLLYGFRVWSITKTTVVLAGVAVATGASIMVDAFAGSQLWGELFEVPLMSAMFVAMVWHARRRVEALTIVGALADERAALLEQEERLLHDVSHELRTPVTIARGHLELLGRRLGADQPELAVAFDELARIERIVDRLLLLAQAERPDFVSATSIRLVPFLEDVFMRWAEVAPRAWRLGEILDVTLQADETWLRTALDALLENAVQYTEDHARIELSAHGELNFVVISVADEGLGIAAESLSRVFERFARSDASRSRREGGAGLGLSIVAAVARAHDGTCTARSVVGRGSVFELRFPLRDALHADRESPPDLSVREVRELQPESA
ncbi:MAG TPA: HAMP domain-containing sensor histidine kinase [Gaiellaceae bacterium]